MLRWDGEVIRLPEIRAKIVSARVLTGGKAEVQQSGDRIVIRVAPEHRQEIDTIIALKLNTSAMNEPAVAVH